MNKQVRDYVVSSGNVFADLGIANPEEALARAELAHKTSELIRTRKEAAKLLRKQDLKTNRKRPIRESRD